MASSQDDGASELRKLPGEHVETRGGKPTEGGKFHSSEYHKFANKEFPLETVLARLAAGEFQKDIAADLGIHTSVLCRRLINNPDAMIAREIGITHKLDTALGLLEQIATKKELADGDDNLARARDAYLKRLEWRASVELPQRFGPKQQITHEVGPDLASILDRAQNRAERVVSEQMVVDKVVDITDAAPLSANPTDHNQQHK